MKENFQPFQYQLNLNNTSQKTPGKIKRENRPKTISLLITPLTDIYLAAKDLCLENNLGENLVLILAGSISEQVKKQIQAQRNKEMNESISSISFSSQQNKTINFKNKFTESLQDSHFTNLSNQSTVNNVEFVTDSQNVGSTDEEEYSFRPATYLKMLDLTDDDEENSNFSVNNLSVNQSYLTNDSSQSKQAGKILVKKKIQKKTQETFDNLCQPSKVIQSKNNFQRKKSTEKIKNFFKPQISPQSKKTLQNIQQSKSSTILTQKSQLQQQNQSQSPQFVRSRKSNSLLEASRALKYNTRKQSTDKQNDLSIYSRGMNFRKKSQQKLLKMKEQEIMGEIKSCTFKPKLNPREKLQRSKILSTNAYSKLI